MTVTDDGRHKVARKLRHVSERYDCVPALMVARYLGLESDERFLTGSMFTSESVKRLADLIQPDSIIPTDPGEAARASVDAFIQEMCHSAKEKQNA